MGALSQRWGGAWRAVRLARVVVVSAAAGIVLGGAAILVIEVTTPQELTPPDDLLAAIVGAGPTDATRAGLVAMVRPALVEAATSDDEGVRAAAAAVMAQVPSGVIVLDVEAALARRAVLAAVNLAETQPAEGGEQLVAQLERAWLPADARRQASAALWELLRRSSHRMTAERTLRWLDIVALHGDPAAVPPGALLQVVGRIARAGFVPGPDGHPTAGRTLAPVLEKLRPTMDPAAMTALGGIVGPASGNGPAELVIGQIDAIAVDPATPEALRRDLAAGATVLQAMVALRSLGDVERALAHVEPLVTTWPADPSLVRLRTLLLRRMGLGDEALAALGSWLGRRGAWAPELRLAAQAMLRRRGRVDEAAAALDRERVLASLVERARLRRDTKSAAARGWRHMADRIAAEDRALLDVLPLAVEAMRLDLALADLRPSRADTYAEQAVPLARAMLAAARPAELGAGARCTLARVLDRAGDRPAATALLEATGGDASEALDTLGRCMWRLGLRDQARATLDRAFDLAPSVDHRARVAFHRFAAANGLEDALAWASKAESLGATAAAGPLLEAQAQLYSRRGQLRDACQILDVLVERADLDEDDAASLVEMASYHRSRWDCRGDVADLERSAALLQRAAALDDDIIVVANRADVLSHLGIVRALATTLRVDLLAPASTEPEFLELAALGGSREEVLQAARRSPELLEATALYEELARRAPAESDAIGWLSRWYELMGDGAALSRMWAELPLGPEEAPVPCAVEPECAMGLRDAWRRAQTVRRRAAPDGTTRAAAAILLAAAARDVAVVAEEPGEPLAVAEAELRGALARGALPELKVALAQVLIAQVADERGRASEDMRDEWLLLPEVDRLRALWGADPAATGAEPEAGGNDAATGADPAAGGNDAATGADPAAIDGSPGDPRIDEAAALVMQAEQAGAVPTRTDAAIASLRDPEAGARLQARWASRPGVLEARQLAYSMSPADPAAVLGLAAALEGRGSAETAATIRAEARQRGVPLPP